MERIVCKSPDYLRPNTSRIAIDVMACLATLSESKFEKAVSGKYEYVTKRLLKWKIPFDTTRAEELLKSAAYTDLTLSKARTWSAQFLLDSLVDGAALSPGELEALIPLVGLASMELRPDYLERTSDPKETHYWLGLANIINHAAKMIWKSKGDERSLLLAGCVLGKGVRDLGMPGWCKEILHQISLKDPDGIEVSSVFSKRKFKEDSWKYFVDPHHPVSACLLAYWLCRYSKLPVVEGTAREKLKLLGEGHGVSLALRSILAQRMEACAARLGKQIDNSICFNDHVEDQLLHMIAEIAYDEGNLPRQLRLAKHIEDVKRSEILLYSLGDYRDHLYHVINVASLGLLLDEAGMLGNGTNRRLVKDELGAWLLAALCHDLGYVLQSQLKLCRSLDGGLKESLLRIISDDVEKLMHKLLASVNEGVKEDLGLVDPLRDDFDHGIISYHYVKDMIRNLPASVDAEKIEKKYSSALGAIAKHNLADEPISFSKEPIAALLVLCDELQDWGRPRWDSSVLASELVEWLHFGREQPSPPRWLCSDMQIIPSPTSGSDRRGTIKLEYHDPSIHGFPPAAVVICKLRALQRLSNLPEIDLILKIPVGSHWYANDRKRTPLIFRDVLRSFTLLHDYPVLRPEVLWPENKQKLPVRWDVQDEWEVIAIRLDKIFDFQPVPSFPQSFSKDFNSFLTRNYSHHLHRS